MRRGRIHISREFIAGEDWPEIEQELFKVFNLEAKEPLPYGVIAYHGISPMFDECLELESPQYEAFFKTEEGKPVFVEFKKI